MLATGWPTRYDWTMTTPKLTTITLDSEEIEGLIGSLESAFYAGDSDMSHQQFDRLHDRLHEASVRVLTVNELESMRVELDG